MADWYGTCRSNYFRVKDRNTFAAMVANFEVDLIEDEDGRVGFISNDYYGSIPVTFSEEDEQVSILDLIAPHLAENEVCVVMEAGAEKARYITGLAIAIAWTGETTTIDLSDIYNQAQEAFGGDAKITQAVM